MKKQFQKNIQLYNQQQLLQEAKTAMFQVFAINCDKQIALLKNNFSNFNESNNNTAQILENYLTDIEKIEALSKIENYQKQIGDENFKLLNYKSKKNFNSSEVKIQHNFLNNTFQFNINHKNNINDDLNKITEILNEPLITQEDIKTTKEILFCSYNKVDSNYNTINKDNVEVIVQELKQKAAESSIDFDEDSFYKSTFNIQNTYVDPTVIVSRGVVEVEKINGSEVTRNAPLCKINKYTIYGNSVVQNLHANSIENENKIDKNFKSR